MKETRFERDVFYEVLLEPGKYIVLPRSEGVCLNFPRDDDKRFNIYSVRSQRVQSVVDDIFSKYDLDGNEKLTKNDLLKML